MSNALVPLQDLERMAQAFAKSALFGAKAPEQVMALLLLAQAEGLHPAIAMRDFDIIQGRPAKKAEAMLRSFISQGGKVEWHTMTDDKADATFSHPAGGTVRIDWDMARAKKAGISNKDNYNKYPRQMLANRVISEGCRRVCPASTSGLYVPEEVVQFGPARGERDITPTAGYLTSLPAARQEVMHETANLIKEHWENDRVQDGYALIEDSGFDSEEMIALWSLLPSNIRSAHKRMKESERAADKGVISPAQHKRLEAVIKERGIDRNVVKAHCNDHYGTAHFTELDKEQYKLLDQWLVTKAAPQESSASPAPAGTLPASGGAAPTNSDLQACIQAAASVKGQKGAAAVQSMIDELDEMQRPFAQEALDARVAELKAKPTRAAAEQAIRDMPNDLPFKPTQEKIL